MFKNFTSSVIALAAFAISPFADAQTAADAAAAAQSTNSFNLGYSTLVYHQLKSPSSLIYIFQTTPDLFHWITPNNPTVLSSVDEGTDLLVTMRDDSSFGVTQHFARVKIDDAPSSLLYPPDGLSSQWTSGQAGVLLQWNDQTPIETGYVIEREVDGGGFTPLALVGADTNSYLDAQASPQDGLHTYRVAAVDDNDQSSYSNQSSLTTSDDSDGDGIPDAWETAHGLNPNDPTDATELSANGDGLTNLQSYAQEIDPTQPYLTPPVITSASATDQGATLTWDSVTGATSYSIYRQPVGGSSWSDIADGVTSTDFNDTNLTNGDSYSYSLIAINGSTQSNRSTSFSVTPSSNSITLPAAGFFYAVSNANAGTVDLEWSGGTNANPSISPNTAAVIERYNNSTQAWDRVNSQFATAETYRDSNLLPRTQYLYRLHFANATGSSPNVTAYSKGQSPYDFAPVVLSNFAASDINDNGVLSGSSGFWKNGTYTPLVSPTGGFIFPYFINNSGNIVGSLATYNQFGNVKVSTFYYDGSTVKDMGNLASGSTPSYSTDLAGFNNSGLIIGTANNVHGPMIAKSVNGSDWGQLSLYNTSLLTVQNLNDAGQVLVSWGGTYAIRSLTSGSGMSFPFGFFPVGLNNYSLVVGYAPSFDNTRQLAKQWTSSAGLQSAGELALPDDYFDSEATAVNNAGDIVGYSGYNQYVVFGNEIYDLNDLCKTSVIGFPRVINNNHTIFAESAASSSDSVLLVPFSLTQTYPSSGFDPQSDPHWLMVPAGGTNSVNFASPANSDMNISLNMQPSGAAESVSPSSTTNYAEYLTVSAGAIATDSSHIQVGVANALGTSGGLNISVKSPQTVNIAIHAITQHNGTDPDIAPANVPTAGDLQTYLNNVYGQQTNTFFHVDRTDYPVDYDETTTNANPLLAGHKNGKLDFPSYHVNKQLSDEEVAIVSAVSTGDSAKNIHARFNLYYVQDFTSTANGVTFPDVQITWLKDVTYAPGIVTSAHILYVAAHEIGHQFGIAAHSDVTTIPAGNLNANTANPIFLPTTETQQQQRLMYSQDQADAPTLLVKPEWDIINP